MLRNDLFITGSTGAIGVPLLAATGPCRVLRERVSLAGLGVSAGVRDEIRVIVHAAAETRFNAPREKLWETNVVGTETVIAFARECPRLERLIHLSTTCVAGDLSGEIGEQEIGGRPGFQNRYEETKWEAERRVLASGLPHSILRIATVVGSEVDGAIARRGAIHHCLDWMRRGLVPMLPGTAASRLDLISSERVTRAIVAAIGCPIEELPPLAHVSGGGRAPFLCEAVTALGEFLSEVDGAWKRGVRAIPVIVDAGTFEAFRLAVGLSGDLLFQQINAATAHFLPALLHPKTYLTAAGDRLSPPEGDWRSLLREVVNLSNR